MTVILECNTCIGDKPNQINLRELGIFNLKELTSKTGWTHHEGGLHMCTQCNDFIVHAEKIKNAGFEDAETARVMKPQTIKEEIHIPEHLRTIETVGETTDQLVWHCRYQGNIDTKTGDRCSFEIDYVSKEEDKAEYSRIRARLNYHEKHRHPLVYVRPTRMTTRTLFKKL